MNRFVVVDIETTGHSTEQNDTIIEIGIAVIENGTISDTYSTLFNPNKDIPSFITNLTGITHEDVQNKPTFIDKAEKLKDIIANSYIIAHNIPFDVGFLNKEFQKAGYAGLINPVLDTVELARIFYPQAPSYKLGQLSSYLGLEHDAPHRALSDALVTADVFLKVFQKLKQMPYETITHLLGLERALTSDLSGILTKEQDNLAFTVDEPEGIEVLGGLAFKKIEDHGKEMDTVDISFGDYLDAIYGEEGSMPKQMKTYEPRQGQRSMSESVYDSFASQKHALIEAETGTGKSLAYLLPAVYESLDTQKRIVISTYTTQLQSQLLEEEIPLTESLIPYTFKVALLKGKSHYISLEKFINELNTTNENNYDFTLTKAMLLVWITETNTGDIDEIQLPPSGYTFFNRISTEAENKVNPASIWFTKSYYQQARRRAQQSNIIITNHALLCADLFNDYQFIPAYAKAVIDEAHHLEETASKHYGLKLNNISMQYTLNNIGLMDELNGVGSLMKSNGIHFENNFPEMWDTAFSKAKHEVDELFQILYQYVVNQQSAQKGLSDIGRIQYRFHPDGDRKWETITDMAARLTFCFKDLIHMLSTVKQEFGTLEVPAKHDSDQLLGYMEDLQTFIDEIETLFLVETERTVVKWVEIDLNRSKQGVFLYLEPTDISNHLAEDFFKQKESVILTSATLTMRQSFSFIQKRLGIPDDDVLTYKIDSPFSYSDQVQLMVPNDFPAVNQGKLDDYIHATCEAILSLAEITSGRMLVLFTSYDMLRKSYRLLKETLDTEKYFLIAQGISSGSRLRLKKNFQTFDQAILLGTSSFWEGVDIPGEDLSSVVIVRLPFQPPNHPVYEARSTLMKEKGQNAFFELALPHAVIRFKQGFGRLIRSSNDRGIVFVCDARIVKSRYGKFFTKSIPDIHLEYDNTRELMKKACDWF